MSTTPLTTLSVSKAARATYNPGDGDNDITLFTDANTGSVQSNNTGCSIKYCGAIRTQCRNYVEGYGRKNIRHKAARSRKAQDRYSVPGSRDVFVGNRQRST